MGSIQYQELPPFPDRPPRSQALTASHARPGLPWLTATKPCGWAKSGQKLASGFLGTANRVSLVLGHCKLWNRNGFGRVWVRNRVGSAHLVESGSDWGSGWGEFDPKRDGERRPERNIDRVALSRCLKRKCCRRKGVLTGNRCHRLGQTGLQPSAPLDLRNPDAGRLGRHPVHPATPGTRRVEHDANLHTGQHPRVKTGPLHHPSGPDWEKRAAFQDRERRVSYSV